MKATKIRKPKTLKCACCNAETKGRQWFNRDMGFGLCLKCGEYLKRIGKNAEEIKYNYGIEGIHWGKLD